MGARVTPVCLATGCEEGTPCKEGGAAAPALPVRKGRRCAAPTACCFCLVDGTHMMRRHCRHVMTRDWYSNPSCNPHPQETFGAMAKTEKIAFILEQVGAQGGGRREQAGARGWCSSC